MGNDQSVDGALPPLESYPENDNKNNDAGFEQIAPMSKKTELISSANETTRSIAELMAGEEENQIRTHQSQRENSIRYLPKFNTNRHSLVMPTRPGTSRQKHSQEATGMLSGNDSPQWGWYINTTPPTTEQYSSKSANGNKKSQASLSSMMSEATFPETISESVVSDGTSSSHSEDQQLEEPQHYRGRAPNRVFLNLQASAGKRPMGWPSVPL